MKISKIFVIQQVRFFRFSFKPFNAADQTRYHSDKMAHNEPFHQDLQFATFFFFLIYDRHFYLQHWICPKFTDGRIHLKKAGVKG